MKTFAAILLLMLPSISRAQQRDIATIYPSGTIAFAELREPSAIADTVARIIQDTPLADGFKLLHDRRDANVDPRLTRGSWLLARAAAVTSPEFLAEFRKCHGAAIGFTGLNAQNEPKISACFLLGESAAAALLIRLHLANEASFRRVGAVEGVSLYQSRSVPGTTFDPNTGKPIPPQPGRATEGPFEPTYAYLPGLFIVGSNRDAIAEIVQRFAGKVGDSFARSEEFRSYAAYRKPGLVGMVRLVEFVKACDAAKKARKDLIDPSWLAYLKLVVNPRAVPILTARLELSTEGLVLSAAADRNPTQSSPLFDLFEGPLDRDAIRACSQTSAGLLAFGLPPKPDRAARILGLADAIAKADGESGALPGEWLTELEKFSGLPVRNRLLPDIRAVSIAFEPNSELPARVEPLPLLTLHLEADANPAEWERAIPRWFAAIGQDKTIVPPTSETIAGRKVLSLPRPVRAVHYAASNSSWTFGLDRKQVAACAAATKDKLPFEDLTENAGAPPTGYAAVRAKRVVQYECVQRALNRVAFSGSPMYDNGIFGGGLLAPPGLFFPGFDSTNAQYTAKELAEMAADLPDLIARVRGNPKRWNLDARMSFGPRGTSGFVTTLIPILERFGINDGSPRGLWNLFDR